MATTSKQRLALAICDFLSNSLEDGTLSGEDKDSVDVAINCIAESYKIDPTDKAAVQSAIGSQNLLQIYGVYEKLKTAGKQSSPSSSSSASGGASAPKVPTEEEKTRAEELKVKGNKAMASKDYAQAIEQYTQALALHPGNAIFLSNRAAAYSAARDHESARADAEAAVAADPKYTKAWSRLGLARFALGDARGSMEAYKQGIEYEGNGGSDAMKKGFETAKRRLEELEAEERDSNNPTPRGAGAGGGPGGMPDLSSLASMFGGGAGGGNGGGMPDLGSLASMFGGGGAGGGRPDLSSIMNNPMFASMAEKLMSNPGMMENLMSNPSLREAANRFSQEGGMPDMSSLLNDPNLAQMAQNMMGGAGRGGGAPGSGSQQ
ncbi:small glutamine-rich tetratricopeptide repeat-containing protein 2-like protein [Poronia punctata]|nr:small glutamine-rich tetratricopeptide repeat-containing protein 2-like protein [Poronia punctata]